MATPKTTASEDKPIDPVKAQAFADEILAARPEKAFEILQYQLRKLTPEIAAETVLQMPETVEWFPVMVLCCQRFRHYEIKKPLIEKFSRMTVDHLCVPIIKGSVSRLQLGNDDGPQNELVLKVMQRYLPYEFLAAVRGMINMGKISGVAPALVGTLAERFGGHMYPE